jgi:serine phosphatase RsbU (regulator of sigma subunit)
MKVAEEMRDYAKEHGSKFGIVTALYTQANLSVKVGMEDRAIELCNQAVEYKNNYLSKVNCSHIYWMLAKIYITKRQRKQVLDALDKCQQEPDLTPYQQMNIHAYKCEAAFCELPIDTTLFLTNYTELQKLEKETGKKTGFHSAQDFHYADITGQYDKMLELAHKRPNKLLRLESTYKAYKRMGRWKEAYDTFFYYIKARDSVRTVETRMQIEMSSLELQTARAENEAQMLKLKNQQLTFVGLVLGTLALAVFFGIFIWTRHRAAIRLAEVKTEQERILSELRIARDIQMSMVPGVFPEKEGLDMSAYMNPAKEVGGDLYGYLLQDNKLYVAVGDVSGKGVPASLFMAQATRLFQTMAKQGMMPAEICTRMNEALSGEDNENAMFVTFWLGLVDLKTGHLKFCNAGHNPPIIGGGEKNGDFLKMIPNTPIGLWPGLVYEGEELDSIKNRPLFIYTDGLNEAENPHQEQFGDDRLLDTLRHTEYTSARQVIESIRQEIEAFRNGAEPNDDLTMMCLYVG